MKRFESFEELLKEIGVNFTSDVRYAEEELYSFLEREGSDGVSNINDKPVFTFKIEIDGIEYELGVTNFEVEEDEYKYSYWIMDIDLEGKQWKEVKHILDKKSCVDMSNFDNEGGIVDFKDVYCEFSIIGKKVNYDDGSYEIVVDDEERIYRNGTLTNAI